VIYVNLHWLGIEIIEMPCRAGDVFLMDLRILHTPSVKSTKNVRMMATTRFFFDGLSRWTSPRHDVDEACRQGHHGATPPMPDQTARLLKPPGPHRTWVT